MTNINRMNFAEIFRADFNLVEVVFPEKPVQPGTVNRNPGPDLRRYTYKIPKAWKVDVGAKMFVNTIHNDRVEETTSLQVVTVISVNVEPELNGPESINYKWVVGTFEDVLGPYMENVLKDYRLNKAFTTLEKKLEQIELRKKIDLMLGELSNEERQEFASLFGTDMFSNQLAHETGAQATGPDAGGSGKD